MFRKRSHRIRGLSLERPGFTPGQVIRLVLAVGLVILALPAGVKAAGSLVTIVDSSTTTKARVDGATKGLRVGGITKKVLDRTGTTSKTFTFSSSAYSQIRIFAEHPGCSGSCD